MNLFAAMIVVILSSILIGVLIHKLNPFR